MNASMDPFEVDDLKAYTIKKISSGEPYDTLIDSTISHIILQDKWFFVKN